MVRAGLVALLSLPLLTACTSSWVDLRNDLDLYRLSFREKLPIDSRQAKAFLACTQTPHDEGRLPLSVVADTPSTTTPTSPRTGLRDGLQAPVQALIQRIRGRAANQSESLSALSGMVGDFTDPSHRRLDLDKLRLVIDAIGHWHGHLDFDEETLSQDTLRFARLFAAYNNAYFGNLKFAAGSDAPSDTFRGVVQVTSQGFVDRSGNMFRFPGLSATVQPDAGHSLDQSATSVDSRRVSADLTRIFLEAFFDAAFRVPAVQHATALHLPSQASPYPAFDAAHPPISLDALATVTRNALRAEAVVTSRVGTAVRGGSMVGTNNETVAATLETAAGVFAKKLVEHEGFCYFQVTQHQ